MDTTPFGYGRPYSRSQITRILRETMFTPKGWGEALFVPPVQRNWFLRSAGFWERAGPTILAPFPGVHIVEASKQAYRAIPVRREKRVVVPSLKPVLAPSTGGAARVSCASFRDAGQRVRAERGPKTGSVGEPGIERR